jgi:hypothetical protein
MDNYFLNPKNNYQKFLLKENINFSLRFIFDLIVTSDVYSDSLTKDDIENFHSKIKFLNDLSSQFNELSTYNILNGLFDFSNKHTNFYNNTNEPQKKCIKNDMLQCYLNYFKENENIKNTMDRSFSYVLSYISKAKIIDYSVVGTLMRHTDWTRSEMVEFLNHLTVLTPSKSLELLKELTCIKSFTILSDEDLTHFIKGFIKHSLLSKEALKVESNNYCDFVMNFETNNTIEASHPLAHLGLILPKKLIEKVLIDFNFNALLFAPELNFETKMVDVKFGINQFISYCKAHHDEMSQKKLNSLFFPNGIGQLFDDAIDNIKTKQHQNNGLKILSRVINFIKIHNNLAAALNLEPFYLQLDTNLKTIIKNEEDSIGLLEKFKLEILINNDNHKTTKKMKI